MLVLQFLEDISDRKMERFMRENLAAKWFCGFGLSDRTPDHSFFGSFRKRLGQGNRASEAFDECAQEVVAPACFLELHAV